MSLVFGCSAETEDAAGNDTTDILRVLYIRPADGTSDDCWWSHELHKPKPARARVRCLDGEVRTLDVIQCTQGTFIDSAIYMGAS